MVSLFSIKNFLIIATVTLQILNLDYIICKVFHLVEMIAQRHVTLNIYFSETLLSMFLNVCVYVYMCMCMYPFQIDRIYIQTCIVRKRRERAALPCPQRSRTWIQTVCLHCIIYCVVQLHQEPRPRERRRRLVFTRIFAAVDQIPVQHIGTYVCMYVCMYVQ